MVLRLFSLASLALMMSGCFPAPALKADPPVALAHNDDAVWVVRRVGVRRAAGSFGLSDEAAQMYGLFACYRSKQPGPPKCFLAQTAGTKEALVWPDDPSLYNAGQAK